MITLHILLLSLLISGVPAIAGYFLGHKAGTNSANKLNAAKLAGSAVEPKKTVLKKSQRVVKRGK